MQTFNIMAIQVAVSFAVSLVCVLLFAPNFERSLADNLLYALRWAVFGGVSLLLVLAHLVRKQIQVLQRSGFEGVKPEAKPAMEPEKQPAPPRLQAEKYNGFAPLEE